MSEEEARQSRIEDIFHELMELPSAQRGGRLTALCAGDASLEREVDELLRSLDSEKGRLETPLVSFSDVPGERLGPYRIVRLLGEGGMGQVYEAEQEFPRRRVALKVIRPDMASPAILRRFEFEATALAQLKHPGIAQIYESGFFEAAALGPIRGCRPYFAMELINGRRIDEFAVDLPPRQLLELMARVADAVHHAHQRGIIHRDLKPGNIFVEASADGGAVGQPKVLDFGVARLTVEPDSRSTMVTQTGQMVGTVAYMSPEQLRASSEDVDTRSDVYALGVILYQLLAGRLPHDTEGSSIYDAAKTILEREPVRLGAIRKDLRGDVDTIVATAMHRERDRRYASAAGLAADIRRFLSNEPIAARPASAGYLVRKFAQRHRLLVASVAAIALVVVAAAAGMSVLYSKEQQQRQLADAARAKAEREVERQRATLAFLVDDTFGAAAPSRKGRQVRVLEVLDDAAAAVGERFSSDPELRGHVRVMISHLLWATGQADKAMAVLNPAIEELDSPAVRPEDPSLLPALLQIAGKSESARGRLQEAERFLRRALERGAAGLPADHDLLIDARVMLGEVLQKMGRAEEAEALLRSVIDTAPGAVRPDLAIAARLSLIAAIAGRTGPADEIEALFKDTVELAERTLRPDAPTLLAVKNNYASFLLRAGRAEEAAPIAVEAMQGLERALPPNHPNVGYAALTAGRALGLTGQFTESHAAVLKGLAVLRAPGDETLYAVEQGEAIAISACDAVGDVASADGHFAAWLRCRWLVAGQGEGEGVINRLSEFRARLLKRTGSQAEVDRATVAVIADCQARYPADSPRRARLLANAARAVLHIETPPRPADRALAGNLVAEAREALAVSARLQEDEGIVAAAESEIQSDRPSEAP